MISICVPTLTRVDLLHKMIETILDEKNTMLPDRIYIIDNGNQFLSEYIKEKAYEIYIPGFNLGVAASWNWFCKNVPEHRLICNDDMYFYEDTLERWINGYDENFVVYPGGVPSANSFSAYIMPDKVFNDVGDFDEEISPHYAYFEDNDYHRRMLFKGYDLKAITDCRIGHHSSSTLKRLNMTEHHLRFQLAQQNYIRKWGDLPGHEKYDTPYNK